MTPLYAAANCGFLECTRVLLQGGANPDLQTAKGFSPLFTGCDNYRAECVKLMLEAKADVRSQRSEDKWTPLHCTDRFQPRLQGP